MEAYLRANGVSVVADHTCYYLVGRDDGKHVTKSGSYVLRFDSARLPDEPDRRPRPRGPSARPADGAALRHHPAPAVRPQFLKDGDRVRQRKLGLAKPLMDAHWTEGVARHLKVEERLRLHLVAEQRLELLLDTVKFTASKKQAPALMERRGRRVYLVYPHFRDRAAGIPDDVYLATPREPTPSRLPRGRQGHRPAPCRPQGPPSAGLRREGHPGGAGRDGGVTDRDASASAPVPASDAWRGAGSRSSASR
ncbi:hypothetical protein SHIRM173S_10353 [Streptomyces hirsutus]